MTHYSLVAPAVFAQIKHGEKIIEPRLNDAAHKRLRLGDLIIVKNRSTKEEIITKVVGVLHYKTFAQLFAAFPPRVFGAEPDAALAEVRRWYTPHDETTHGVLGIKLHRLTKEV